MDVRQLIYEDAAKARSKHMARLKARGGSVGSGKSPTEYRIRQCLDTLNEYAGENTPVECLQMMSSGWIDGFVSFMTEGAPKLSATTAGERKKRLGSYCRDLIQRGLLPNISVFPNRDREIGKELENIPARNRPEDVKRLISLLYVKLDTLSRKDDVRTRSVLNAEITDIGTALLSVLLGGIGYGVAAGLCEENTDGGRMHLRHLGVTVTLPPEINALVDIVGTRISGRDYSCGDSDSATVRAIAARSRCTAALSRVSLDFAEGFGEPFVQWIELARAGGISMADQRSLIDLLFVKRGNADEEDRRLVQRAMDCAAKAVDCGSKKWYCIKCAGRMAVKEQGAKRTEMKGVSGTRLRSYIEELDSVLLKRMEYFTPYDPVVIDRDGRKTVKNNRLLDELLFFKANRQQVDAINRMLMANRYGFIFCRRKDNGVEYSEIVEHDIDRLRLFLEVRDDKRFAVEDFKTAKGTRVKVIAGIYEGYEGEVRRVVVDKRSGIERTCFVVDIPGICAMASYNVDHEYLVKIG